MLACRVGSAVTDLAKELLSHRISGVALPLERDELLATVPARRPDLRVDDPAGAFVEVADLRPQCGAVRVHPPARGGRGERADLSPVAGGEGRAVGPFHQQRNRPRALLLPERVSGE